MITENMNRIEIAQHIRRDVLSNPMDIADMAIKFRKKVRQMPMGTFFSVKQWTCRKTMQTYIIAEATNLGTPSECVFAKVDNGRSVWYYCTLDDITDTMDALSTHFFRRYAERTGKPSTFPSVIARFACFNGNRVKIYENEQNGDTVYASNEGISLCRADRKRGITKFCTFVSKDMLKPTQRQAYDAVLCKIQEADRKFRMAVKRKDIIRYEEKTDEYLEWSDSCDEYYQFANDIYRQYFDEMEKAESEQ